MKASILFLFLLSFASAAIVSTLPAEQAPRVTLTVLANASSGPSNLFARYSAGVSRSPQFFSTPLSTSHGETLFMNNSYASVSFFKGIPSISNSTGEETTTTIVDFGPLNEAPWWNSSFETRRSITVTEPVGVKRESFPVEAKIIFEGNEARIDAIRLKYWDGLEHRSVPFEIVAEERRGHYLDSITILFLADVDANSPSLYQFYSSATDWGLPNLDSMALSYTSTHLIVNDTVTTSFRLANQTGKGEIDSLVFEDVQLASYNFDDERGALSFEIDTVEYGTMKPTDTRSDESILFKELVVETNSPVRTVIRRTSILRGTLNERYTFYRDSPLILKETEFFPIQTLTIPVNPQGSIREPDAAVSANAHNNTFTWGGPGTRLSPTNWTRWYKENHGMGFTSLNSTLELTDQYLISDRVINSYNNTDSSSITLTGSAYYFDSAVIPFTNKLDMQSWYEGLNNPPLVSVSSPQETAPPQLFSGPIQSRILYQSLQDGSLDAYTYISLSAYRPEIETKTLFFPRSSFSLPVSLENFNITTSENITLNSIDGELSFEPDNRTVESVFGAFSINSTLSSAVQGVDTINFTYIDETLHATFHETIHFESNRPLYRKTIRHPESAEKLLIADGATYTLYFSDQFSDGYILEGDRSSATFFWPSNDATIFSLEANLTSSGDGYLLCDLNMNYLFNFTNSSKTLLPASFIEDGENTLSCEAHKTSFHFPSARIKLATSANPDFVWGGSWSMVPLLIDWHHDKSKFVEVPIYPSQYGLSDYSLRIVDDRGRELPLINNRFNTTLNPFRENLHYLAFSKEKLYSAPSIPGGLPFSPGIDAGVAGSFVPRAQNPFRTPSEKAYPIKIMPPASVSGSARKVFVDEKTGAGAIIRLVIWT